MRQRASGRAVHALRTAFLGAAIAAALPVSAAAQQTLGMVGDTTTGAVTVFDADTGDVLGSVDLTTFSPTCIDVAIRADLSLGFAVIFGGEVWVIDLTTTPPSLAAGTNPIPISNPGEDIAITPDQQYLVICDGGATDPISVVDIAARQEISTFSLGPGTAVNSVDTCSDGSVLVTTLTSPIAGVHRLTIDAGGNLSGTGERLPTVEGFDGPNNVSCAPGATSGIVILREPTILGPAEVCSFTIPGLPLVDLRELTGDFGLVTLVSPTGDRAYFRSQDGVGDPAYVDIFSYDQATGALGAAPETTISGITGQQTCFGVDTMALDPNGTKLYVTEDGAVRVFDAATGDPLPSITHPDIMTPQGIAVVGAAECFLVIGEGSGNAAFSSGGHTWPTLVSDIQTSYPVTMIEIPSFEIPVPRGQHRLRQTPGSGARDEKKLRRAPRAVGSFTAQVLMWNPSVFPENPEQWTNALQVTMWSDGTATARPYGAKDGMNIAMETYESGGRRYVRFPFTIDGF